MNQKKKRPAKIELDGERGELVIVWKGGGESRHALVELRQNCPCAMCRDQRAQGDVQEGELTLLEGEAATATAAETTLPDHTRRAVVVCSTPDATARTVFDTIVAREGAYVHVATVETFCAGAPPQVRLDVRVREKEV